MWCSLIFVLHMDGVHVTTKRNMIYETIGNIILLCFKNVVYPHQTTSEPIEHFFGFCRYKKSEFNLLDFIDTMRKIIVICRSIFEAGLRTKLESESTKGYKSSTTHESNKKKNNDDKYVGGCITYDDNDVLFEKIWKILFPILNETKNEMKIFLKNMFGIENYHAIITEMTDDKKYIIKLIENGHKSNTKKSNHKKKQKVVIVGMQHIDVDDSIGGSTTVTEKSENCTDTELSDNSCYNDNTDTSVNSRDTELSDNDTELNETDAVIEGKKLIRRK